MGLPEFFVVDGVERGVAAVAAYTGAEIAEDSAGEDDGGWVLLDSDGDGAADIEPASEDFDVGDDVFGLTVRAGHTEQCSCRAALSWG